MEIVYAFAIALIIVVVGFLFFLFMPKSIVFYEPPAYDWSASFDELKKELKPDAQTVEVIYGHSLHNGELNVTSDYPMLYEKIREIGTVYYAGLITLKPEFKQKITQGYAPIANQTVRYFYPFKISATRKSGIVIDGETRFFAEATWLCADVSREHSLFNNSLYDSTVILFIDVLREGVPAGVSKNQSIDSDTILNVF
jgi:hypothetical protein